MFRIGGEEELLGLPTEGALDASAPESPVRRTERTEPISARVPGDSTSPPHGLDTQDPAAQLSPSHRPLGREAELAASGIDDHGVGRPPSRRRRRRPGAHQRRSADSEDHGTAPPARRRPPGLTGWHSGIAWINAGILTVLILAAVIGHDPSSMTPAGRESPAAPEQAVVQPAASAIAPASTPVDPAPATARSIPEPRVHRRDALPSNRPHPRVTAQAYQASATPADRPSPPPIVQRSARPAAAVGRPVAASAPPDPRSPSTTRTPNQRRREAENSQNAASVEFGP